MATELTGGCELAELMANHILGDVDGYELIAIVNSYRVAHEVRANHGSTCPCLYDILLATLIHSKHFLLEANCYIWTFLK